MSKETNNHLMQNYSEEENQAYKTAKYLKLFCNCCCVSSTKQNSITSQETATYQEDTGPYSSCEEECSGRSLSRSGESEKQEYSRSNCVERHLNQAVAQATSEEPQKFVVMETKNSDGPEIQADVQQQLELESRHQTLIEPGEQCDVVNLDQRHPQMATDIGGVSAAAAVVEAALPPAPGTQKGNANVLTHKLVLTDLVEKNHEDQLSDLYSFNLNKDRVFYRLEQNKAIWDVPQRYTDVKPVGAGSYGLVSSAFDTQNQMKVAIKKLARPFQSPIHAKRTYREMTLLAHMKHENVIGLLDVFSPCKSFLEFNEVYLVTHLMGADLNSVTKHQRLTDDHIQFLVYQMLRGLKYIHSAGIIHRDLKPSNIAVNENCDLKVLDFGLARHTEAEMTGYVATRWYRAPEIMLNWMRYNQTVDIWSVGCIMAELITSRTLFPGKDHIDQLLRIMTLCGTPDADFMTKITSEEARNYVRTLPVMKRKNFYEIFAGANPLAIDLLDQMLKLDSDLRPTAEQALAHPYLAQYADPSDEPTAPSLYDESFEEQDYTVEDWRRLVWKEIVNFKLANPG